MVFGGETQEPIDPVPAGNRGIFRIATNLYAEGYDIHMYEEPDLGDNPNAEDIAFREVTNSLFSRSVSYVAVIGYSHGGGSTWNLANRLTALTNTINIGYTAYLDAVAQPFANTGAENRRPPSSAFHVNYYQANGIFELGGGPIDNPPGANFELDVQSTEWGANLDHGTIDDHPNVLDGIISRLRTNLQK